MAALVAVMGAWLAVPASAAPKASDLVRAELLIEPRMIEPGRPFTAGVRLSMADGWHTYWRNPGDSGLATEIAWALPAGFRAGPIAWPTPSRIPVSHLVNYGYEGEATFLVEITPPAAVERGGTVALRATVSYLVCERECIPGEANLATSVPVSDGVASGSDPATAYVFTAARASLPVETGHAAAATSDGDALRLRVSAPGLRPETVRSAYLFPADETTIEHAAPQEFGVDGSTLTLSLRRSALSTGAPPAEVAGVLVVDGDRDGASVRQAFQFGSPSAAVAGTSAASPAAVSPISWDGSVLAVGAAALLAFAGGLLLNLMPCVFPVLSIKVLSLVRHSGGGVRAVRIAGLAYAAGIVLSFLALAAILLVLRGAGAEIGWGFQLQSPAVVLVLALLLFAVGLSLSGAVEFGTGLAARAAAFGGGSGPSGSFMTGVLAAVVATPCTAPFMGAAVGYALTAPAAVALVVFAALGIGMAAPFLLLTLRPSLLSRLPRPGGWMETLKQALAFPIYATVAWLIFVLSQQVGATGLLAALLGLVLVGFAVWCRRITADREGFGRRLGQGLAALSLLALLGAGWGVVADPRSTGAAPEAGIERFSQARLDALRREGRPVFVNMTAAWCITCLVNERAVLSTAAVKARFDDARVAYLKGDWTNQDPEITRLLEQHGRSGVPLYVVYRGQGEPVVLPQILTQSVVLDSLAGLAGPSRKAAALGVPSTTSQE